MSTGAGQTPGVRGKFDHIRVAGWLVVCVTGANVAFILVLTGLWGWSALGMADRDQHILEIQHHVLDNQEKILRNQAHNLGSQQHALDLMADALARQKEMRTNQELFLSQQQEMNALMKKGLALLKEYHDEVKKMRAKP